MQILVLSSRVFFLVWANRKFWLVHRLSRPFPVLHFHKKLLEVAAHSARESTSADPLCRPASSERHDSCSLLVFTYKVQVPRLFSLLSAGPNCSPECGTAEGSKVLKTFSDERLTWHHTQLWDAPLPWEVFACLDTVGSKIPLWIFGASWSAAVRSRCPKVWKAFLRFSLYSWPTRGRECSQNF